MTDTLDGTALDQRTADARAWFREFHGTPGGAVRLALARGDHWDELQGFRADRYPFAGLVPDHLAMLDALAASAVASADEGHDVFACPYAHAGRRRRQGGAICRAHVHADIDGPLDLARVRFVGGMAVASGSVADDGRPHGHVYARLAHDVPPHVHAALCRALGQRVGAAHHDPSKTTDVDVLRPAGTLNHKSADPRPVRWLIAPDDPSVRTWQPEALARLLGVPWPVADLTEVPPPVAAAEQPHDPGALAARLDGLARSVTDAPPRTGNDRLNWAAGVAAALCATDPEAPPAEVARAALVAAYLARPVPPGESARTREAEARRTAASGWQWGSTHPAQALAGQHPPTDESASVTTTTDDPEFWDSRAFLRCVRDFARARRVGPWALLGAVLARAAASVPPSVVLPPTRGTVASLNVFVGLCSPSGGGKTVAMEAAREFLDVQGGTADYLETSPGSGEGLLAAYCYVKSEKGKAPHVIQTRTSVLLDVDEVGSLGALVGRTNSTLLPFLKSAWSGKGLATQNADTARLRRVEGHRYRLSLVCGVQPVNAGTILDDEAGGFPQRWLWMPTYDPGMLPHDARPTEPPPWRWQVPAAAVTVAPDGTITLPLRRALTLPDVAVRAMLAAAEAQNRPIGAAAAPGVVALDGHALLTRAKVAGLLALLDDRAEAVTEADWTLAGTVLGVSDATRAAIAGLRRDEAERAEDHRAQRSGRSAAIAADSEAEVRTVRCMNVIRTALGKHGGEHSTNAVYKFAGRYRNVAPEALARLVESGEVQAEERDGANGKPALYHRLAVAR